MSRFFGQSKSNVVSKPTLNDTASIIDSRVEVLNRQIAAVDQELQVYNKLPPAKKASQKSRALALLGKKKMYEKQRTVLEGQASNIGVTAFAVSNIETQRQIYHGLKGAKDQMAKGYKDLKIEKVDDLMDELDDQIHDQDEMNEMFTRPIGQDTYTTDADLESELAGLAEQEFYSEATSISDSFHAPSVPVQPINTGSVTTQNGVQLDKYGLPILPGTAMRN